MTKYSPISYDDAPSSTPIPGECQDCSTPQLFQDTFNFTSPCPQCGGIVRPQPWLDSQALNQPPKPTKYLPVFNQAMGRYNPFPAFKHWNQPSRRFKILKEHLNVQKDAKYVRNDSV